jgi:SAM-dependent methyltransferase
VLEAPGSGGIESYDGWLRPYYGELLAEIEDACVAGESPGDTYVRFRPLPDGAWAMLLSGRFTGFPGIRRLLPTMPPEDLQMRWNGAQGLNLLSQSQAFYSHVKAQAATHLDGSLDESRVLDFGCGWGRLTRFFARDVAEGALCGCDPVEQILGVCREHSVPGDLRRSGFVANELPFEGSFDLIFSFSVFTHLSEAATGAWLTALHRALRPGGLLVLTVRPPAYLSRDEIRPASAALGPDPLLEMDQPRFVFVPHPADPSHPQYQGEEMSYGEAVITPAYARSHWSDRFELVDEHLSLTDPYQVALTLRRRP